MRLRPTRSERWPITWNHTSRIRTTTSYLLTLMWPLGRCLPVFLAADNKVIEALDAEGLNEAFGVGVHVRRQRTDTLYLVILRLEHCIEAVGELRVVVDDQVSDRHLPIDYRHGGVASLLCVPLAVRTHGRIRVDDFTRADVDEKSKSRSMTPSQQASFVTTSTSMSLTIAISTSAVVLRGWQAIL